MIERTGLSHDIAVALVTEGIIAPEMLIGLEGKDLIEVIEVDEGQAQAIINQVTVKLAEAEQNPPAPETEDAPAQAAEEKVEEAEQAPQLRGKTTGCR